MGPEKACKVFMEKNPDVYCVESPDGLTPSGKGSAAFMRYTDSGITAGTCKEGNGYRTVCLGFPVEALESEEDINEIITLTLEFFSK